MERSLEKLLIMIVPMFVDLQGFIVGSWFVVKEVAVLKKGSISLIIFLQAPIHGIYLQNPKNLALLG